MLERPREALHVRRRGKGDDGDLTPGGLNLLGVSAQLCQVVLAEQAAEVAEKDQDGRAPQQLPRGITIAGHVPQIEIKLDSRHRDEG